MTLLLRDQDKIEQGRTETLNIVNLYLDRYSVTEISNKSKNKKDVVEKIISSMNQRRFQERD